MHATDAAVCCGRGRGAVSGKELGRSQLVVFTSALAETAAVRFATEQVCGGRWSAENSNFSISRRSIWGLSRWPVEALLRWRMPDGRLAAPGEFLAIAEQSGLIVDINDWVLRTAVERAADWHRAPGPMPGSQSMSRPGSSWTNASPIASSPC